MKYLIDKYNFKEEDDDNTDDEPVIINKSYLVSNNGLTFIRSSLIGTIRLNFITSSSILNRLTCS